MQEPWMNSSKEEDVPLPSAPSLPHVEETPEDLRPPIVELSQPEGKAELHDLRLHAEIHLATAFVCMKGRFHTDKVRSGQYVLAVPMSEDGIVTSCTLHINPPASGRHPERYIDTIVTEAAGQGGESVQAKKTDVSDYLPSVFRVPCDINQGDFVEFEVNYTESLLFDHESGMYYLQIPLGYSSEGGLEKGLPPGVPLQNICRLTASINAWGCDWMAHPEAIPMAAMGEQAGGKEIWLTSVAGDWNRKDAMIMYRLRKPKIEWSFMIEDRLVPCYIPHGAPPGTGDMMVAGKNNMYNPDPNLRSFAVVINPPQRMPGQTGCYARKIVFILDKSYSMSGDPIESAKDALIFAMQTLKPPAAHFPGDMFTIIAFSHIVTPWGDGQLVTATPEKVGQALEYIKSIQPDGATNISEPIKLAYNILNQSATFSHLPFIVLATDGCVHDEARIIDFAISQQNFANKELAQPRVLSFGIGPYCNASFLRTLSRLCRGHFLSAYDTSAGTLKSRMKRLIAMATGPLLTGITLKAPGGRPFVPLCQEVIPFPIPDLTTGAPVLVCGRILAQNLPPEVSIEGQLWDGTTFCSMTRPCPTYAPVARLFMKQLLDFYVAQFWIATMNRKEEEARRYQQQAVETSCAYNMPCALTTTVAAPMTPAEYHKHQTNQQK
eukprot:Sspe_Gene.69987::Locus_41325_Transcript_1_1_Confidence_1.000_Length_2070::g.69987::m.69987